MKLQQEVEIYFEHMPGIPNEMDSMANISAELLVIKGITQFVHGKLSHFVEHIGQP